MKYRILKEGQYYYIQWKFILWFTYDVTATEKIARNILDNLIKRNQDSKNRKVIYETEI